MPQEYVGVEVQVCRTETDKAVCLTLADGRDVWVPWSQLEEDDRDASFKGERDFEICVTEWFARKEELV